MPKIEIGIVSRRYGYACGYCGVTETNVGSHLTIDHYQPRSMGGNDDDDNLVYAYIKCNQYKGNFWPTPEQQNKGEHILHPLLDDLTVHLQEDDQGYLQALTETGQFHIVFLKLNRPQLVENRQQRQFNRLMQKQIELLEQNNQKLRSVIEVKDLYINFLQRHSGG